MYVTFILPGFFWAQDVMWHLHNLDTLDIPSTQKTPLAKRVPFLEHEFKLMNVDPRDLPTYPSPRLLKTHISHRYWADNLQPVNDKVKVILWTAEPKDVVANYIDFWNIKGGEAFNFPLIQWDHFFDLFKRDRLFEGNWYLMNMSWLKAYENNKSNLLLLSYEESRANPSGCVLKMAGFLGIKVTEEQVTKIVNMRQFDKWGDWSRKFDVEQKKYTDELTKKKVAGSALAELYPCDNGIIHKK